MSLLLLFIGAKKKSTRHYTDSPGAGDDGGKSETKTKRAGKRKPDSNAELLDIVLILILVAEELDDEISHT